MTDHSHVSQVDCKSDIGCQTFQHRCQRLLQYGTKQDHMGSNRRPGYRHSCMCRVRGWNVRWGESKGKQNKAQGRRHRAGANGRRHRAGCKGQRADLHDDAAQGALQSAAHNGCSLPPHALQPLHQQGPPPPHILLPLIPPPCIPAPHPTPLSILEVQQQQTQDEHLQGGSMVAVCHSRRQVTFIIVSIKDK